MSYDIINAYFDIMLQNVEFPKEKFLTADFAQVQSKVLACAMEVASKNTSHKANDRNRRPKHEPRPSKQQRPEKEKGNNS